MFVTNLREGQLEELLHIPETWYIDRVDFSLENKKRLSNFLLWQVAHTELWFTDVMWPDFNEKLFYQAILDYQMRKNRA